MVGVKKSLRSRGDLPVKVIFLVEAEEETGSPDLEDFPRKHITALTDTRTLLLTQWNASLLT